MRRVLIALALAAGLLTTAHGFAGQPGAEKKSEPGTLKKAGAPAGAGRQIAKIDGELKADDPADGETNTPSKVHKVKLEAGKSYRLEMRSTEIDSFLRLEDPNGKELAKDDDGAGFPNSRIVHAAKSEGEYRLIATSFPDKSGKFNTTGKYTITVNEAAKDDVLRQKIAQLGALPAAEQQAVVAELKKHAETNKLSPMDAQMMMRAAVSLEQGKNRKFAAATYADFAQILSKAGDPKLAEMAKTLEGAARRVNLPGQKIVIKGMTLEGKDFDWSPYKNKVVLVDFWATWCGPCIAEIPGMKKAYQKYHDKGFEIVAISIDTMKGGNPGKQKATDFMKNRELPWTCLFDEEPGKGNPRLAEFYGIFFIPQAILVGRDGTVISMNARGAELERLLEKEFGGSEKNGK